MEAKAPEFNEIRRNVAGIDLAWRADNYVCGPRKDNGEQEIVSFGTTTPELHRLLSWLQERKVESVAMESTSVYWIPLADLLESKGIETILVDPREVRMVPGRKSDVQDCQWLQKLHSCGLLRGAFRPPEQVAAVRSILREKDTAVKMRAQLIQQMQKCLDQMNIRVHHAVSDLDGKTGIAIIKAIVEGERDPLRLASLRDKRCKKSVKEIADHLTGTWRKEHLFNLKQAFLTFQFIDERIAEYDLEAQKMFTSLAEEMGQSDAPCPPTDTPTEKKLVVKQRCNISIQSDIKKIMKFDMTTIPGISHNTAAIILSELGNSFDCFPTENHFVSYIGLAPSFGKSAGKNVKQKKRCKNTSRAGLALRMSASSLYHSNSALGAYFRSVARRIDRKTAVMATARRIAQFIYRGVKYGKEFIDCGVETFEARARDKAVKTAKKLLKTFNINPLDLGIAIA
jgi:transposase